MGTHDHLALKDAARCAIEDGLEQFATLAMGHSMVDHQRGVRMLLALEEINPAQGDLRPLAAAAHEGLPTQHLARADEGEGLEARLLAHIGDEGGDMQLRRLCAGLEHMGERSARAHGEDHGAVTLDLGGRRMALNDRGARALTHQHQRA